MILANIFEKGLPAVLVAVKSLSEYSEEEKRKHKKEVLKMPLEDILGSLEDYLTKLPENKRSNITIGDRITMVNCQDIFMGISVIFELEIKALYETCRRNISAKERILKKRALNTSTGAIKSKPRVQKPIEKITLEEPIFIDSTQKERFSFDRPIDLTEQGGGASLVPSIEDGLRAELPRVQKKNYDGPSAVDLHKIKKVELREDNLSELKDLLQPILDTIRKRQETLQDPLLQVTSLDEQPVLGEDKITDISVHPVRDENKANELVLGKEETNNEGRKELVTKKKKRSCYCHNFYEEPHKTTEEYERFLRRKKKAADKANENTQGLVRKFIHLEDEYIKEFTKNYFSEDLFHFDFEVPTPVFEMGMVFRAPVFSDKPYENLISKFELLQRSPSRYSAQIPAPDEDSVYHDGLRSNELGMTGLHISGLVPPEAEPDIPVDARELLPSPSVLPIGPRTSLFQQLPRPSAIVAQVDMSPLRVGLEPTGTSPVLESPSAILQQVQALTTLPRTPAQSQSLPEGSPRLQTALHISQDAVLKKLQELCSPEVDFTINFLTLCPVFESRLVAASVFQHLINFWSQKIVLLTQTGSHPSEIYIKLNQN